MSSQHDADRRLIGGSSPAFCVSGALILCSWLLSWAPAVHAADTTWTLPVSGSWTEPARWTGGVPTATDSATFNSSGEYTVYLSSVFQSLNNMSFSGGAVTFERLANPATLLIDNDSGGRDLTIGNATLNMGETLPVNITVGDDTIINSAGTLNVRAGSALSTQDLFVNAGGLVSLGSGTVSTVNTQVDGTLAVSNGGKVTSSESSIGSVAGSSGAVNVSGAGSRWDPTIAYIGLNGSGTVLLENGGTATTNNTYIGANADSTGLVTVSGAGSRLSQFALVVGYSGVGSLRVENGGTVHSGDVSYIGGALGPKDGVTSEVTVTGPGSTWSMRSLVLSVGGVGMGALTISDGGAVQVEGFSGPGMVSINAVSRLNIGAGGLAGTLDTGSLNNDGTLNFDHTDSVTFSAPISGAGTITKNGAGATTLSNASSFTGTITSSGGQLILQGSLSASLYAAATDGALRFDGSTVNLSGASAIRTTGGTVEYSGANVNGGILRGALPGAGTHAIVANPTNTRFNGVTIQNSVDLIQNADTNFTNVTNGGRLTSNASLFFDGGANTTSGNILVNQIFHTRDFTNYGQITVNSGSTLFHSLGNLASGGGSRITVNAGGLISLLDGNQLDLNGALLVNNGTISGTVNVNYGSLAKGGGVFGAVNITDGGVYSPGASPGQATLGSLSFNDGGRYLLEIADAAGAAGSGYDSLTISGGLDITAGVTPNTKFTFSVASLDEFNQPGDADNFDPAQSYAFVVATTDAGITGFAANKFTLDVSAFENDLAGGRFSLQQSGSDLLLAFSPAYTADFDEDGEVDGGDLVQWKSGFGTGATHMQGDADGDGDADGADFLVWQRQVGSPPPVASASNAIPEPLSAVLFAMGLAIVGNCAWGRSPG